MNFWELLGAIGTGASIFGLLLAWASRENGQKTRALIREINEAHRGDHKETRALMERLHTDSQATRERLHQDSQATTERLHQETQATIDRGDQRTQELIREMRAGTEDLLHEIRKESETSHKDALRILDKIAERVSR